VNCLRVKPRDSRLIQRVNSPATDIIKLAPLEDVSCSSVLRGAATLSAPARLHQVNDSHEKKCRDLPVSRRILVLFYVVFIISRASVLQHRVSLYWSIPSQILFLNIGLDSLDIYCQTD
jgi:hypothetical protein